MVTSLLTGSFTVWFGYLTVKERQALDRVVRHARSRRTTGSPLPLEDIYSSRLLSRAPNFVNDLTGHHPADSLFTPLPSGIRHPSIKCLTSRYTTKLDFPCAGLSLNKYKAKH